jgi:hypothetical protein
VAVGSTLAALIASGIPSVYYPHLPPEFSHPLPQLFAVLIAHDYAPHNAAGLVGVYGTAAMVPLGLLALGAIYWCVTPTLLPRDRLIALGAALPIAVLALLPGLLAPEPDRPVRDAVAYVTTRWSPEGHDRAARLAERLRADPEATASERRRLADLYLAEGRDRDAQRWMRPRR